MIYRVKFFLPILLSWLLWAPSLQSACKNHVQHLYKILETPKELPAAPAIATAQKRKNHFKMATLGEQQRVLNEFLRQMAQEGGIRAHLRASQIQRVTSSHLAVNLNNNLPQYTQHLRYWGGKQLGELVYLTSGAGLWSRGGEVVKALVPYNLAFFCSDQVIDHLRLASKILGADNEETVLKLRGYKLAPTENVATVSADIVSRQKRYLQHLMRTMVFHPKAINPIDVKLITVAIYSILNKTYLPFDIWTSQSTNRSIQDYLLWLKANLGQKIFHPQTQLNHEIQIILAKYFNMASSYHDNNVFAYQESFHAIDLKQKNFDPTSPSIGPGAGAFLDYYRKSGRYEKFKKMGKSYYLFDNIEIVTDIALIFGAHLQGEKPISVVVVPERPHYKGGSPFLIQGIDREWHFQVREMSSIPKELTTHNQWFNTNTIVFDMEVVLPIDHPMTFELKTRNTQARIKLNAADPTIYYETAGIGGRLDLSSNPIVDYENFKTYDDYLRHGIAYLISFQNFWERLLSH